jgi:hypothetical protein
LFGDIDSIVDMLRPCMTEDAMLGHVA